MLYDTDKYSEDRGSPKPNITDVLRPGAVKSHGTHSVNYVTDASNLAALQPGKNGQFTIVKTGTATLPGGAWGSGVSSANPQNLTITLATIAHGLAFKPALQAYVNIDNDTPPNGYFPLPWYQYGSISNAGVWYRIWSAIDSTNIYFFRDIMWINFASGSFNAHPVKYYLLQQTADNS